MKAKKIVIELPVKSMKRMLTEYVEIEPSKVPDASISVAAHFFAAGALATVKEFNELPERIFKIVEDQIDEEDQDDDMMREIATETMSACSTQLKDDAIDLLVATSEDRKDKKCKHGKHTKH